VFCFYYYYTSQYETLTTKHSYHLVNPRPWPILASLGAVALTSGFALYMHKFVGGGIFVREATFKDRHSVTVQKGLRLGMVLFIASEIMFFCFFLGLFHSSIASAYSIGSVWPPKSISSINTFNTDFWGGCYLGSSCCEGKS
jgi:cytochrome c oxidase subunit III